MRVKAYKIHTDEFYFGLEVIVIIVLPPRSTTPPWYHEHRGSGLNYDKVYGHSRSPSPSSAAAFQLPLRRQTDDRVLATPTTDPSKIDIRVSRVTSNQAIQTDSISKRIRVQKPSRS